MKVSTVLALLSGAASAAQISVDWFFWTNWTPVDAPELNQHETTCPNLPGGQTCIEMCVDVTLYSFQEPVAVSDLVVKYGFIRADGSYMTNYNIVPVNKYMVGTEKICVKSTLPTNYINNKLYVGNPVEMTLWDEAGA